jgi:regulator of protease activity HflC (stomatin/prohibitin superfamily)
MDDRQMQFEIERIGKALRTTPFWILLALIVIVVMVAVTIRIGRVRGTDVGVLLNKMNGKPTVITKSGVRIYNGITHDFFVLDKTLQTLEMVEAEGKGDRPGKDNLKIKTVDGSDVYVDIKVQYRMDPNQADVVLLTSGPGDAFKEKWARDYMRSLCRNFLGELTTEEFYASDKRDAKIMLAQNEANRRLTPYGIQIDSVVVPTKPHFYAEYEELIKKKKLADQAVLEEQSKALAAAQLKETLRVEETNKKNVAVEEFSGKMEQKVIKANAERERARKAADAYFDRVTIGAEASLYELTKQAEGIVARKKAEAEGISELRKALEGPGGLNMVKLEYARKLKEITITGQPFTRESDTSRFEHMAAPAFVGGGKTDAVVGGTQQ